MPQLHTCAIVPTLNRRVDLLEFCDTMLRQTVPIDELIVVDAGDDDQIEGALRAALQGSPTAMRYLRSEAGTSLQRNLALEQIHAEFVFLFDDDVLLEDDYVERSLECFELPYDPPVGCVLGTFSSPSREQGWRRRYFELFDMTHSVAGDVARQGPAGGVRWLIEPSRVVPVPVASGGRTVYRAEAIADERFDEFLPGYTMSEDVEYSYRVAQGWSIVQTPHARLFHKRSPSSRVNYGDRVSRLLYSRFYFFHKHLPKDPRSVASFAWSALGISAFYSAVGVTKAAPGHRTEVFRGLGRAYARCARDLMRKDR